MKDEPRIIIRAEYNERRLPLIQYNERRLPLIQYNERRLPLIQYNERRLPTNQTTKLNERPVPLITIIPKFLLPIIYINILNNIELSKTKKYIIPPKIYS